MDIIFIDTSVFEANNFLESKRIKEIYKIAEKGYIKVVLPRLTYDEIINRISKNIEDVNAKFNKYRNDARILRNLPSFKDNFKSFDVKKTKKEVTKIVEDIFEKSNFEIIDYPTLNIEEIFKSYFQKQFPFGSGGKKSEFPDAFALKTVEIWAKKNNKKVLAFSKDKDMLNYESNELKIIENFDKYLSDKIKEIEVENHAKRLKEIDEIIENKLQNVIEEIKKWVEYQLDDFSNYYEYSNSYEVHDFSILEINIKKIDYDITNVSDDYISVQLKLSVNYKVEIIIDDEEYMIKDYDTKEWIFMETKPVLVDENRYIDVDLIFGIEPDEERICEPEIETINNNRNLNV